MMASMDSNLINTAVDSLNEVIHATNPHLKGRLISVLDMDSASGSFSIMKRVKCTLYYYNPETQKKTSCLTVQEIMRIPSEDKEVLMDEYSKRFLTTVFMWTSSKIYKDLIDGKFESKQRSDSSGES